MILEVLVVFHRSPGASPDEAILTEQTMAEITLNNLVAIGLLPVNVGFAVRWLYNGRSVFPISHIRIIKGVDING